IGSAICCPMFRTGFREFIAPWKMIEISFHRIFRILRSETLTRSRPRNRIEPETIFPLYGRRRINESAVVVFPQPLSPARPRASPSSRSKETPSTACTAPDWVAYSMTRSLTSRSRAYRLRNVWWLIVPGLCLVFLVFGFYLFGFALDEILNP